jgi:hypothetical protein
MPQQAWSDKRERQYEHIKEGVLERGEAEETVEEIAARTVNKERARGRQSQGSQPHLDRGHLLGSPGRAAIPPRTGGSHPRPALQRSPREEHLWSLQDDQGRA